MVTTVYLWGIPPKNQEYPYPHLNPVQLGNNKRHRNAILKAISAGLRPKVDGGKVGPEWHQLMAACWQAEPDKRPSFGEILETLHTL